MARPSDYTAALAEQLCGLIAEGKSLREICQGEGMPDKATVMRWLQAKPEFRDQYARARELQADFLFEETLAIADDASGDFKDKELDSGTIVQIVDHEHISRSKLRVDTRKWVASKLAPKKYGDRVALTSPEGGAIQIEDKTPRSTPAQVMDELTGIFGAAAAAARAAPHEAPRGDSPVRPGAKRGGGKKPRAPAARKKVARKK